MTDVLNPSSPPAYKLHIVPDPNPWEDKDKLPSLPLPGALLLSLLALVCTVYLSVAELFPNFWSIVVVCCVAFLLRAARSLFDWMVAAAIFLLGYLVGGVTLGTIALCVVLSVVLIAFLVSVTRSTWLVCLPFLSYIAVLLLSGSIASALLSLITYPAGILLAYSLMKNHPRVTSICITSGALLVCLVSVAALWWIQTHGNLSIDAILGEIEQFRARTVDVLMNHEALAQTREALNQLGIDAESMMTESFNLMLRVSPALLIVLCNVLAYAAQLLCVHSFVGCGMKQLMTRTSQLFIMSLPAAIIYLICFIVCSSASLFSDQITLTLSVMENLELILMPGLFIVGFWKLVADFRRRPSLFTVGLILICGIVDPTLPLNLLALSGAVVTLMRPFIARMIASGNFPGAPGAPGSNSDTAKPTQEDPNHSDETNDRDPH